MPSSYQAFFGLRRHGRGAVVALRRPRSGAMLAMRVSSCLAGALILVLAGGPPPLLAAATKPSVRGVVLDQAGRPVPNAAVILIQTASEATLRGPSDDSGPLRAISDASGAFTILGAVPGTWRVEVVAEVSETLQLRTTKLVEIPQSQELEIELRLQPHRVERVVVTGIVGEDMKAVPGGTAVVSNEEIERSLAHNLKDVLGFVPGVLAQPRFGADESQVSIRGSGLRNNFHHRGTNLLINGIPYQDADGFGDFESFDLLATERIEIWKGANALRYGGNASGGAINFVTHDGATASPWKLLSEGGSWGLLKAQIAAAGDGDAVDSYISGSHTSLDGYREHSEQKRGRAFGNIRWNPGTKTTLVADLSYANVEEELPGSLDRDQFEDDPRQAGAEQVDQDWGRRYDFGRAAVGVFHRISDRQELGGSVYGQLRNMVHPIFQVLDQHQRTMGGEIHYRFAGAPDGRVRSITAGFAPQYGRTDERRYENIGGESGDLVNSFDATAENYGLYAEADIRIAPPLTLLVGARADRAIRSFDDRYPSDGDRSDRRTFEAVTPRLGLMWDAGQGVQVFGNVSRSYEPPLLLELTSFGSSGFLDLEAQDTWQYEIGSRGRWTDRLGWDVSAFHWDVRNEIINTNIQPFLGAPFTVPSYRNADRTSHTGLEIGFDARLASLPRNGRIDARAAYTLSMFRFEGDPNYGDNDIPGVPSHLFRGEVRVQPAPALWCSVSVDWSPSWYFVDSANTARNDAYAVMGLKAGYDWNQLGIYVEAANLNDERYSASVQVDDALGRYYEPSNTRSFYVGVRWSGGTVAP